MAKTQYLEYYIHLTNKAQVDALQAANPNGLLGIAPATAAATYSAPIQEYEAAFVAPCVRSPWFWFGPVKYPRNVASFSRTTGGIFGISFLFGTTTTFKWFGRFVYAAPAVAEVNGVPTTPSTIPARKWAIGFEMPDDGEMPGTFGTGGRFVSRDASRHADGFGVAFRRATAAMTVQADKYGAALSPQSWERFYIRVRNAPAVGADIWKCLGSVFASAGALLQISSTLQLALYNVNSASVATLLTTHPTPLVLNRWYRLDVMFKFATFPGASLRAFLNGVEIFSVSSWPNLEGLSQNGNHVSSRLGNSGGAATELEIDYDDYIGADWPGLAGTVFTSVDFRNGSKVVNINPRGFGATHDASWVGNFRLPVRVPGKQSTGNPMTSSTSGAILAVTTDADRKIDASLGSLGCVAICVNVNGRVAGAANGSLGYKLGAAAPVLTVLAEAIGTQSYYATMYRPAGLTAPADVTPLELHYVKAASADLAEVWSLHASAELIGVFGDEDVIPETVGDPLAYPARKGNHVAPYPETVWARRGAAPISPVITHTGNYAGNSTGQDLQFRCPVTFFFVRRIVAGASCIGVWWASSWLGPHISGETNIRPEHLPEFLIDPALTGVGSATEDLQEQRTLVRVAGATTGVVNLTGQTYQYFAFEDPGGRFSHNFALEHANAVASFVNALANPQFIGLAGIFISEIVDTTATIRLVVKGVGHTGTNASKVDAAETANNATFGTAGQVTTHANLHQPDGANAGQTGAALFRMDDGSADPNKHKVVKIGSYVGDGLGARTITFVGAATGLRPLFAILVPHNAAAVFRDPAYLGTVSGQISNGNEVPANGIQAGVVDGMTVATQMNTFGIVYDYIVFMGSATAGNNGWSIDGEFSFVEPDSPFDGDWAPDPTVSGTTPPSASSGGPTITEDCTTGGGCASSMTELANLALTRIGVSQILTDLCTDTTREAAIARVVFEATLRLVLRDFPWPFATKYAALVQMTSPVQGDWLGAWRVPDDCVFERRLVASRGIAVDPEMPPFALTSDVAGRILLTNEIAPMLEYTCRPTCAIFTADELFTECFAWRLGAALAPALSRMTEITALCLSEYVKGIEKANAVIKPQMPGLRPSAGALDQAAASVAANLEVVNQALIRIGAQTVSNLAIEQSREAVMVNLIFEGELQKTLRDHAWAFATRYATPALVGGTATTAVNDDWQYSYRAPSDCVKVRRLTNLQPRRAYNPDPQLFRMGSDATGSLIFANDVDIRIEYTARLDGIVNYGDHWFREALAWRLAAVLAPSLAQVDVGKVPQHGRGPVAPPDPTMRQGQKPQATAMRQAIAARAWFLYQDVLAHARADNAQEQQQDRPGDADWILGR